MMRWMMMTSHFKNTGDETMNETMKSLVETIDGLDRVDAVLAVCQ